MKNSSRELYIQIQGFNSSEKMETANTKLSHRSVDHGASSQNNSPINNKEQQQLENDKKNDPVRLERRLGLWNGVAIIIGVIIGSGIFISPTGVFKAAGSMGASLFVWAICGLLSLMGALCMAELGTSVTESGGDYSYIKLAYGPLLSFLYLWVTVLIILPCSNAVAALTFSNYILQPFYDECKPPDTPVRLFALAIILILVWVNCYSVNWSIKLQNSFTLTKVLALVLIISFGIFYIILGKTDKLSQENMWSGSPVTLTGLGTAFYSGLYSYAGWNALNFVTEEIKEPVKNVPRAIIISITSITVIYILVNIAYFAVLSQEDILNSSAIAVTFGKQTLGVASFLMPLSVALSTTSGLNALIFSSSRILFVGARQGQLFSLLNMISVNHRTPIPSLLFVGFMSMLYLSSTAVQSLVNYLIFIEASFAAIAVSTLLVLRYKFPNMHRPLKVHTYIPVIYLAVSFILIVTPIYSDPWEAFFGTLILLTGIPAYYLTANWAIKPPLYQKTIDGLNSFTQKLTVSVSPEEEKVVDGEIET